MRRFFEVFKTLKLPEDIGMYMENVEVTRVSKTSTNSLARVYIKNDRVISKKIIYRVEAVSYTHLTLPTICSV